MAYARPYPGQLKIPVECGRCADAQNSRRFDRNGPSPTSNETEIPPTKQKKATKKSTNPPQSEENEKRRSHESFSRRDHEQTGYNRTNKHDDQRKVLGFCSLRKQRQREILQIEQRRKETKRVVDRRDIGNCGQESPSLR